MAGQMEGSVEEVDTGEQSQFHSENELIRFLRKRFARPAKPNPTKEGSR